jgi:cytochrome c-type biogenesis protein CcmE
VVTDFQHELPVKYDKVLPDLFREGQGVVAHGRIDQSGVFIADEVLAKHDEKYMPPEVAKSLKNKGQAYVPAGTSKPSALTPAQPAKSASAGT